MPSAFKKALDSGKFVVTCEAAPSKGTNLEKMTHHIELLKDTGERTGGRTHFADDLPGPEPDGSSGGSYVCIQPGDQ